MANLFYYLSQLKFSLKIADLDLLYEALPHYFILQSKY